MTDKNKDIEQHEINEEAPLAEEKAVEIISEEIEQAAEETAEEAEAAPEQEKQESGEDAEEEKPEAEPEEEKPAEESEEPEEEVKVYEPHEKKTEEAPTLISSQQDADIPSERQPIIPAVQYSKSLERERKIAQEVKKRQRRPMVFILAMCALLIVLAIIVNAVMKDVDGDYAAPTPVPTQTVIIPPPTVEPAVQQPEAEQPEERVPVEPSAEPEEPKVSSYEIFKEDISWTAARDKCVEKGGHLAVISTQEEFDKVVEIARTQGVDKLWIGCQRVNGNMVWVTEDQVEYYPWAQGEPTGVDSFDGAAEDYVLLWNNNGWFYNDSRNDPAAEFPQWYSGTIGYVCEFEE